MHGTGPLRRRRHRRSWQRARKVGLGLLIVVLALELVYRLVALPPDYGEQRAASLSTETVAEAGRPAEAESRITEPESMASNPAAIEPPAGTAAGVAAPGLRINRRLDLAPRRSVARLAGEPPAAAVPFMAADAGGPLTAVRTPADPALAAAAAAPTPPVERDPVEAGGASLVDLPVAPLRPPVPSDPETAPLVAIVIDDMGYSPSSLFRLARLPGPLTLAFLPYADGTAAMLQTAAGHDFELMLHLPMEPLGDANPGPEALLVGLDPTELRRRVRWAIGQVPGAVGVNNHMGSRFTVDAPGLEIVMEELRRHGLFYLDSRTNSASLAEGKARAAGLPVSRRNVFLDHDPEPRAITRQLALLERIAQRHGNAIAIGHPYPTTLAALEAWLPSLEGRGFRLVRVSEVIAERLCDEGIGLEACAPALHLVGSDAAILPQDAGEAAP
jgi:uncharacterized protein